MKYLLFALAVITLFTLGMIVMFTANQADDTPGVQDYTYGDGITMLPSTIPVKPDLQAGVMAVLHENLDYPQYAITDVQKRDSYYIVSVAALPEFANQFSLADSVWLGTVMVADTPGYPGILVDIQQDMENSPSIPQYGQGGGVNIFPWRSGTTAQYGTLGVHNCGFALNGWKAVDFFPSENMVYSTNEGSVNYVCRDGTQVALKIGDNLYTHLVDSGQAAGDYFGQGQQLGGMVPGTYNASCGYADQQEQAYHVHFCFIPNSAGTWAAEGWVININNNNWVKGAETVEPLGTLTANWETSGDVPGLIPGPAAGGNLWDSIVSGITWLFNKALSVLPEHDQMFIVTKTIGPLTPLLAVIYILFLVVFDMTYWYWVVGIIVVLEGVRIIYAGWMWIKRALPLIG